MSEELEKKVARLQRSLDRERAARKEAESLLEEKSREIYESNEELKAKFAEADLKQTQLSYLTGLSADIWHANTITDIIKVYLTRTRNFLQHSECVFCQFDKTELGINKHSIYNVSGSNKSKEVQQQAAEYVSEVDGEKVFQLLQDGELESQLLSTEQIGQESNEFSYVNVVPIFFLKGNLGVAFFLYQSDDQLDVFKLQTVESSRSMLTVAIQRKTAALGLQKRYKELKDTYEQLDEAQKQLAQSEKMASLGQLAAGVAHEINNPIGFILSNYETLADYVGSLDELLSIYPSIMQQSDTETKHVRRKLNQIWQDEDIDFIREDIGDLLSASKNGLTRIRNIVSGLKSFSHIDGQYNEKMDLNDCVEDAIQLVWNELKYDCELERDFAKECIIKGNSGQLQQVFVNFLVNAKQAMPQGGKIKITTERLPNQVLVKVKDSGSGIAKEDLDKLFTPFFTTKPVGVGTGLGLSISYGILQDHNAEIDVTSEINVGTEFTVTFPLDDSV